MGTDTAPRGEVERGRQLFHTLHNLASPSPVTNGKLVVAHYGNGDLAAYDFNGQQLWKRNLQADHGPYTIWYGHANSPVLYDDLVLSVCLQDALADRPDKPVKSYVVAHELANGRQRWKTVRMTGAPAEEADAYTTPLLVNVDGQPQLLVMGGNQLDAYDPRTGRQLWFLSGLVGGRTVTSPTVQRRHDLCHAGQTRAALRRSAFTRTIAEHECRTSTARNTVDRQSRDTRFVQSCCARSAALHDYGRRHWAMLRHEDRQAEMETAIGG